MDGKLRTRNPGNWIGLWLAQGLVAALAVLVVSRSVASDRGAGVQASVESLASSRRIPRPARAIARAPAPSPETPGPEIGGSPSAGLSRRPLASHAARNPLRGAFYSSGQYRSRRVKDQDDAELWDLDPEELDWLLANQRRVLTEDLDTVPESGGGLRLVRIREASFGASRGLQCGDILLNINGQDLDGPFDVEDLLADPAYRGAKGWRILLLREGKPLTLDYRMRE